MSTRRTVATPERLQTPDTGEFIQMEYNAVAPLYDDRGNPITEGADYDRWHWKMPTHRYHGDAGQLMELSMYFRRVSKQGADYFVIKGGRRVKTVIPSQATLIPFSQKVWDRLVDIREEVQEHIAYFGKTMSSPGRVSPTTTNHQMPPVGVIRRTRR